MGCSNRLNCIRRGRGTLPLPTLAHDPQYCHPLRISLRQIGHFSNNETLQRSRKSSHILGIARYLMPTRLARGCPTQSPRFANTRIVLFGSCGGGQPPSRVDDATQGNRSPTGPDLLRALNPRMMCILLLHSTLTRRTCPPRGANDPKSTCLWQQQPTKKTTSMHGSEKVCRVAIHQHRRLTESGG